MKKLITFFAIFIISVSNAQNNADTIKEILPITYSDISNRAAKKWPNNEDMKNQTIERQCSALIEYISLRNKYSPQIPINTYSKIGVDALDECSESIGLDNCSGVTDPDELFACYKLDYEKFVSIIKNKCNEFISRDKNSIEFKFVKERMPETYSSIIEKATIEWPNDFDMQQMFVDKQCKAIFKYLRLDDSYPMIPEDVYNKILESTLREWSQNDPGTCQEKTKGKGYDAMLACLNADWDMLVFSMEKQFKAYISLH